MNHLKLSGFLLSFLFVANTSCGQVEKGKNTAVITKNGNSITVKPLLSTSPIVNPGKGWAIYGSVSSQPPEVMEIASLSYKRYNWGHIEPEEGVFRWDIIDADINEWAKAGKDFSFGVMGASTHSRDFWVTPKWVFDTGAPYDTFDLKDPKLVTTGIPGAKLVPVFDHPVFMEKMENFINALAKRYDGHPNIAFIDIRSYGNWGEGHMHPFGKPEISAEMYKKHIQIHRDAFQTTLLQIPTGKRAAYIPVYEWAVSVGIGLRRDGICGNSDGTEVSICNGKVPAVFEFFGNYEMMKELGWWDGKKDAQGRGFRLEDCVENGMPTYCDLSRGGKSGLNLLQSEPELIRKLTNRLGYHFVIHEARYPGIIKPGNPIPLTITWENQGVAQMFIKAKVSFALLTPDGKVSDVCDATSSMPGLWKSDQPVTVDEKLNFKNASPGKYILAVGILRPDDGLKPSIRLGIEQRTYDGWHEIGPFNISSK